MSFSYDRTMAYRANRAKLVEQATYTMADAIREQAAEDAALAAKLAAQSGDKEYIFAPKDAAGRPLVEPFIIKYSDQEDLRQKLTAETANVKFVLNRDKLVVADTGAAAPTDFAAEVERFLQETPDYYKCPQNFNLICLTAEQNNLSATVANLKAVYDTLTKQGLLIGRDGQPTKANTSGDKTGISYTLPNGRTIHGKQALEAMPANEYKRRLLNEPGFAARADKCLSGR